MDIDVTIGNDMTMRGDASASVGHIDQYELLRELGGGGFGCVYLARDTVAGIEVAVKGLPPEVRHNKEELENIRANFALVSRLHHPNIAAALVLHPAVKAEYSSRDVMEKLRVFERDTMMVMEYAPGVTLSQWRKQFLEKKVPFEKALAITRQVAAALDYAHGEKIVHRDVKPSNVVVETREDGSVVARVLDFGLAAEIRSSMGRVSREIRDTSGTRPYMAPEQWRGAKQGPATDQYALAAMFCELVTGEVPFASVFDTGDPVLMKNTVLNDVPELPVELPKAVRAVLVKALAKSGEERFASCTAFADALGGVDIDSDGFGHRTRIAVSGSLLALAALVGIGCWLWFGTPSPKAAAESSSAARSDDVEIAADNAPHHRPTGVDAEMAAFQLSSKAESAHAMIERETDEVRAFFEAEIRAFENDRRAGDDAKRLGRIIPATNFLASALAKATALKASVVERSACLEMERKMDAARAAATSVRADTLADGIFRQASELAADARKQFVAHDFASARMGIERAFRQYDVARKEAETRAAEIVRCNRVKAKAVQARTRAEALRKYAQEAFDAADREFQEGEGLVRQGKNVDATAVYDGAARQFAQVTATAERAVQVEQKCAEFRKKAMDAREEARLAGADAPDVSAFAEADELRKTADRIAGEGRLEEASETFSRASGKYADAKQFIVEKKARISAERKVAAEAERQRRTALEAPIRKHAGDHPAQFQYECYREMCDTWFANGPTLTVKSGDDLKKTLEGITNDWTTVLVGKGLFLFNVDCALASVTNHIRVIGEPSGGTCIGGEIWSNNKRSLIVHLKDIEFKRVGKDGYGGAVFHGKGLLLVENCRGSAGYCGENVVLKNCEVHAKSGDYERACQASNGRLIILDCPLIEGSTTIDSFLPEEDLKSGAVGSIFVENSTLRAREDVRGLIFKDYYPGTGIHVVSGMRFWCSNTRFVNCGHVIEAYFRDERHDSRNELILISPMRSRTADWHANEYSFLDGASSQGWKIRVSGVRLEDQKNFFSSYFLSSEPYDLKFVEESVPCPTSWIDEACLKWAFAKAEKDAAK